jgi:hypothetical protein
MTRALQLPDTSMDHNDSITIIRNSRMNILLGVTWGLSAWRTARMFVLCPWLIISNKTCFVHGRALKTGDDLPSFQVEEGILHDLHVSRGNPNMCMAESLSTAFPSTIDGSRRK